MRGHLPLLLLTLPFLAVPVIAGFSFMSTFVSRLATLGIFIAGWILGGEALPLVLNQGIWSYNLGGWPAPWGIETILTPFSLFLAGWVWLIGMVTWFYGLPYWVIRRHESVKEGLFNSFLFLMLGSALGLLFLRDMLGLYFCIEIILASVSGLLIVGQARNWFDGFRFFFWGSFCASLFLLAAFFLYSSTGTLYLDDLLSQIFISKDSGLVLVSGLLISLSFMTLFSFPLPYFYSRLLSQSPPFVTGLLSSVLVRVAAYVFFVLLFFTINLPEFHPPGWLTGLEYAAIPLFLAHFIWGFRQKDFQQAIAYISVAQLGYLFAGFLLGSKSALTGTLLELVSQILATAGLFYIAGTLRPTPGALPVSRLMGLARQKPWTGLALIVFAASIAGIPPTGGALGKWYLLQGALERSNWIVLLLIAAATLLNLFYLVKLIVLLYEHRDKTAKETSSAVLKIPILVLALSVLMLGVFHQTIIQNFIGPALPKAFLNSPMPNVPFLGEQVE